MDVLDEVAAGGRLTRSLRKRLTSVDSEASSSRPNTPIATKLNSISEQSSPPRSTRMTRRNSVTNLVSTPLKTPSKTRTIASRLDTTSEINSPMRRVNRRRSISITEDDEMTTKSAKPIIKIHVAPKEESSSSKRVTRSSSKSPLQLLTNGKIVENTSPKTAGRPKRGAMSGRASKSETIPDTRTNEQTNNIDSDVEVIDLESEDEVNVQTDIKTKQNKINSMNKPKAEDAAKVAEKTPRKNSRKTPQKPVTKNKLADKHKNSPKSNKQTPKKSQLSPKIIQKPETESETDTDMETVNQSVHETEINETVNEIHNIDLVGKTKTSEILTKPKLVNLQNSPISADDHVHVVTPEKLNSPKNNRNSAALVTNVINLKSLSPEVIKKIAEFPKQSPAKKNNIPEKLKVVSFNDSIEDDAAKSSYPKTPCSTKSKSYTELDSPRKADLDNSFQALNISDSIEIVEQEMSQDPPICEEQTDATHTPIKSVPKLTIVQSSTPLLNSTKASATIAAANTASNEEEEDDDEKKEEDDEKEDEEDDEKEDEEDDEKKEEEEEKEEDEEEEIVDLKEAEASILKSPEKSLTSRRKSLVDSPSSKSLTKSLEKSPRNHKKSISLIKDLQSVTLDTTRPSELEQISPEKLEASPNKSSSPQKSPRSREYTSINKRKSIDLVIQNSLADGEEEDQEKGEKETKIDSSEDIKMSNKSLRSLELARKHSLDTSSPNKRVLRNSPKKMQSPKISTSIKSPEEFTSLDKSMSPKKTAETIENLTEEMQSDEPSSTRYVTELSKGSTRDAREFASSWNPSVSGVSSNTKIDEIIAEKEKSPNPDANHFNDTQQELETSRRSRFESDDDDESITFDVEHESEVEADEELGENEKPRKEHEFILGEAMEADDDYQSGDSMDSEERREMENNEAQCDGESIGSVDTTDGTESADDEENASFIADDSSEASLLDDSDGVEETENQLKFERRKNKKNLKKIPYRRILTVDDDDSDTSKDNDDKSNSSQTENIEILIDRIGKIVDEDKSSDDDIDDGAVIGKNSVKTSQKSALDRSETFDVKPVAENFRPKLVWEESPKPNKNNNNVSIKERRKSLNRAKATEEPEEEPTNQDKNLSKKEKQNEMNEESDEDDREVHNNEDKEQDDKDQEDKGQEDDDQEDKDQEDKDQDDARNNNMNSSKLSETTMRLQVFDTDEESSIDSEYNDQAKETSLQAQNVNASRKMIIKHLQKSERFNKTVHDFRQENPEEESGSLEAEDTTDTANVVSKNMRRAVSLGSTKSMEQRRSLRSSSNHHHRSKEAEAAAAACETSSSSSEDESHQSTEKQLYKTLQRYSLSRKQEKANKQDTNSSNKTGKDKVKRLSSARSTQSQEKANKDEEEYTAINGDDDSDTTFELKIVEEQHQFEKSQNKKKHSKSSAALSVSLGYIKERYDERIATKNAHNSFTIGVVVKNNAENRANTPEPIVTPDSSLNSEDDDNRKGEVKSAGSDTETEAAIFSSAEEEQLDKLEHTKYVPLSAGLNSSAVYTNQTSEAITDFKNSSKQRRTICIPADYGDFTTSQSFIESVAAESRGEFVTSQTSTKRKRLSKSFCAGASLDTTELEEVHHLNKKSKFAGNDIAINSSTPRAEEKKYIEEKKSEKKNIEKNNIEKEKAEQKNIDEGKITKQKEIITKSDDMKERILSRCDEILEAANRAKLEAKLNSNKSKVKLLKKKKSKKMAKEQQQHLELKHEDEIKMKENDVQITQKQLKRQEKAKLEIEKALKASANLILNKTEKKVIQNIATQQLPKTVLEALCNTEESSNKEQKPKHFLPSKVNKKVLKTSAGEVHEIRLVEKKKKKVPHIEKIQLSTGTVRVEPATPKKQLIRSGFRESPMTPPLSLGFKVRHILSAGQDTPPVIPVKERKRKRNDIEEPTHTLPKPQWTKSGVFIEEEIYASAPITTAGSTKFIVSALNGVRKKKKKVAKAGTTAARSLGSTSVSVSSSALQFKNNALFREGIQRESSRELIQRKQRKNI